MPKEQETKLHIQAQYELSKQYWDLEHTLVAQAEEPWSDDENGPPLLNLQTQTSQQMAQSQCILSNLCPHSR